MSQAWWTAVLNNQRRMPPLKELLHAGRQKLTTVKQQRAALESLAEYYGLKTRKRKKPKPKQVA